MKDGEKENIENSPKRPVDLSVLIDAKKSL